MSVEVTRIALKRYELLEELQAVIARQLEEMGTAPDAASVIGSSAVDYLSTYWAGQVVTFPKYAQYKLTLKELEIYDQFDGRKKDDLARRYGMTPRGMGKLLKRIRGGQIASGMTLNSDLPRKKSQRPKARLNRPSVSASLSGACEF